MQTQLITLQSPTWGQTASAVEVTHSLKTVRALFISASSTCGQKMCKSNHFSLVSDKKSDCAGITFTSFIKY